MSKQSHSVAGVEFDRYGKNYLLTSSSKVVSTSTLRFTSTFDDAEPDDKDETGSPIFFFLLAKNDRMSTGVDAMLYLFKSPKMREEED